MSPYNNCVTSSSSSSCSLLPTSRKKTMEEVWKDISLNNLQEKPITDANLQKFLLKPIGDSTPSNVFLNLFSSQRPQFVPTCSNSLHLNLQHSNSSVTPSDFVCSSTDFSSFSGKRMLKFDENSAENQLKKRMVKNRESAARSRARKQAYMNQLEREVQRLMKENAKLWQKQQEFCLTESVQPSAKKPLCRTSTAPF